MSDILQRREPVRRASDTGHLAWRAVGVAALVLSMLIQVWLSGRLGSAGQHAAALLDYLAIATSFVLALAGLGLIVIGRDALRVLRGED